MHGCELIKSTPQNLGANTPAEVVFTDADVFDPHNWHDPSVNPENIVVGEAGLFLIYAQVNFAAIAAAAGDLNSVTLLHNDNPVAGPFSVVQLAAGNATGVPIGGFMIELAAGDDVSIEATDLTGATPAISAAGFTVYKIADSQS